MPTETLSVLLVLDEEPFALTLATALGREGFAVTVVPDGAQALAAFDGLRPALVLLEAALPDQSGMEVCRELRRRSDVPIVLMSTGPGRVDAVAGLEAGADDCVSRPERVRELMARVRALVRRRRPVPGPGPAGPPGGLPDGLG